MKGIKDIVFTVLLFLVVIVKFTQERALDPTQHLYKYGYLNSMEADVKTTETALKMYQEYFGLRVTGNLDEETMRKMSQPRCGMPDMPDVSTFQFICDESVQASPRWDKKHISYKIRNWTTPLNNTLLEKFFDSSIKSWTKNISLQISASETNESEIDVYFKYLDSNGTILAYACSPEDGNIYFNTSENWSLNLQVDNDYEDADERQIYIGWAVAHELGHSLGLHHVNTLESVMYPIYNTEQTEPSTLDKNMIRYLYRGTSDFDNKVFCDKTSIDAMIYTSFKNYILVKGNQFWSFNEESLEAGPFPLDTFFPGLPDNIDAAFSVKNVDYFLTGDAFYKYVSSERTYRKKFISIGFENVMPSDIDAAFFDPNSDTIYFFKGAKYYGFNINRPIGQRLAVDGKKISEHWPGVPDNIEAATYIRDGKVLFIKNSKCYKVDAVSRKILHKEDCTSTFFKCSRGNVKKDVKSQQPRRCGRPRNVGVVRTAPKWTKKHLTYKIWNWTESVNETELKTLFQDVINLWTTNVSLQLSETETDNADIDVYFKNLDGKGDIIGYADFPETGSIYFDSSDEWSLVKTDTDDNDSIYAGWLVAHELGHSFGLDHEETTQSIMYPIYNNEQTEPSRMDKHKLKELYEKEYILESSILCSNASVDAMMYTSTKTHILIKGKLYWRFLEDTLESGPYFLNDSFRGLPDNVDAAFSVRSNNYFLKDDLFYRFKTKEIIYKKKMLNTTFENLPGKIDAVFFESNSETINFFKGTKYYVCSIHKNKGPRIVVNGTNISEEWDGVPNDIEAATYLGNNTVLFIKDSICYTVEFSSKKLLHSRDCGSSFFKCSDKN